MKQTIYGATVKYERTQPDGNIKTVAEQYLVNAISIQDASMLVTDQMTPYIQGDFNIESIRKVNIDDIIEAKSDYDEVWYMVKFGLITLDEKTAEEKMMIHRCLVCTADLEKAVSIFRQEYSNTLGELKLISVTETKYLDYFRPKSNEDE